jgi:hypothetical protein
MKKEKDTIKIVGDFTWKQTRDIMIMKLIEIDNEEDFGKFVRKMSGSIGTLEDIKKTRERLGIKPLTEKEIKEMYK